MENATNANLDKICRTCLLESPRMVSLTSKMEDGKRTVNDVLLFVLNNNVMAGPRFPQQVCGECELLLYKLDEFKQRCSDSEKVLKEILNVSELDSKESVKLETHSKLDKQPSVEHYFELNPVNMILAIKEDNNVEFEVVKKDSKEDIKNSVKVEFGDDFSDGLDEPFDDDDFNDLDGKESFTCPCKKTFTDSKEYHTHLNSKDCIKTSNNDLLSIPVKCERCDIVFKNTKAFKVHARIHSSNRQPLSCNLCGRKFKKRSSLQSHLDNKNCRKVVKSKVKKEDRHSTQKKDTLLLPVKCEPCDLVFKSMKLFKEHSRMHKKEDVQETQEYYSCSICTRKFKKKSSLITHLKNHEERDNVKYTCSTCKREFKYQAHLDNHISSEHNSKKNLKILQMYPIEEQIESETADKSTEKKHSCKMCSKSFTMLSTLTDHMRTHTGERPFLCSVCGRGFTQKTNLAQHMRRHLGLKPFKCGECERRFVSKGELDAHTRKHSGAHPFVCDACGNGFTTSSSLRKHKRVHTGERPYACDLCPMKFAVSGTLKSHRRTHTGEKPYQCSYCEKAFVQRQDLVSHIRCHTGERPFVCAHCGQRGSYQCSYCEKAFVQRQDLVSHIRCHTGERPFVCAHCGQAFRKPSALKAHVKTHKMTPQPPPGMLGGLQPLNLLQGLQGTS